MKIQFSLLLLFSFFSCSQTITTKSFENDEFSIRYPLDLELSEGKEEGAIFIIKTSSVDNNDVFIENINLVTQEIKDVLFNEFVSKTQKEIENLANVKESEIIKINGRDCFRIIFSFEQHGLNLTFIQHYLIKNNKVYVLTFSSESKFYNDYFVEMNDVLMSFKLK